VFVKSGHSFKTTKHRIRGCISHVTAAGTSQTQYFTNANLHDLATFNSTFFIRKAFPPPNLFLKHFPNQSAIKATSYTRKNTTHSNDASTMSQYFDNGRSACMSCISQHQPALLLLCVILIQLTCLIWGMWYVDAHFMPKGKD
jgi:hypothetical protein